MKSDEIRSAISKLKEINSIILKLAPSIRAAAFDILAPLFFEESITLTDKGSKTGKKQVSQISTANQEKFFTSFDLTKPSDNVMLIVAWLYSQYGKFPISRTMLEEQASKTGLTIPERPDKTMVVKKAKGKNLFHKQGKGWQLTVSGESYVKETFNVKKGKIPLQQEDNE